MITGSSFQPGCKYSAKKEKIKRRRSLSTCSLLVIFSSVLLSEKKVCLLLVAAVRTDFRFCLSRTVSLPPAAALRADCSHAVLAITRSIAASSSYGSLTDGTVSCCTRLAPSGFDEFCVGRCNTFNRCSISAPSLKYNFTDTLLRCLSFRHDRNGMEAFPMPLLAKCCTLSHQK